MAEPAPDAHEILRVVRIAQSAQHQTLYGQLRTGPKTLPFKMIVRAGTVRYEFSEPAQAIQLRLLEKESRLEEITQEGTEKVSAARFDKRVRDTDISYEDLAMKFLYWPNATVEGEATMLLRKCWVIRTEPSSKTESQYGQVKLWIEQQSGALLQAEAMDGAGKFARRFKVISGQKIDGGWVLKQMRIESGDAGGGRDHSPTYLEVKAVGRPVEAAAPARQ